MLPAQQHAVVESVSKNFNIPKEYLQALGWNGPVVRSIPPVSFTALKEIEKALERRIATLNIPQQVSHAVQESFRG